MNTGTLQNAAPPAQDTPGTEAPEHAPFSGRTCACGASAFGQPPGLCYTHALEAERGQAQRMLVLARHGIVQARRLAAHSPQDPALQREAHQWLAEAQDDLRDVASRLADLSAPPPITPGWHREGR